MIRKFLQWLGWRKERREPVGLLVKADLPPLLEIEVYEVATGRVVSRTPVINLKPGGSTVVDVPPGCWFCLRNSIATGPATSTITAGL